MYDNELVERIMDMLLAGNHEVLALLRKQYRVAEVISEEKSEVGFFVKFHVEKYQMDLPNYRQTFQIGDVGGMLNGIEEAVGFVLFIKDGVIEMLEGYTCAIEKWPQNDSDIVLNYHSAGERESLLLQNICK